MRRVLLAALLPAAALVVGLGARPARAETIADLLRRQEQLSKLIEEWILLAERDVDEDKVEAYRRYKEEADFKAKDRVKAEDLVAIIANPEKSKDLRLRSQQVLEEAAVKGADPDLAVDKRGDLKRRMRWAREHVLPLLTKSDEKGGDNTGRGIADRLLNSWFQGQVPNRDSNDVKNYDATKERTWGPAARVWREVLK